MGGIILEAIGFKWMLWKAIGFKWMLWIIAIANVAYAPLLFFLRNPPGNEKKVVSS